MDVQLQCNTNRKRPQHFPPWKYESTVKSLIGWYLRIEIRTHFRRFRPTLTHDINGFRRCGTLRCIRSYQWRWLFYFCYYLVGRQRQHAKWLATNHHFLHNDTEWIDIAGLCAKLCHAFFIAQNFRGCPQQFCGSQQEQYEMVRV